MFSPSKILKKTEMIEEYYVQPVRSYLQTRSFGQIFIEEISQILSEKNINSKFRYKKFPFKCNAVSIEDFCNNSVQREIEFFCQIFRSQLFVNTVLNKKQFTVVSLQECNDFIQKGVAIENLDETHMVFIFQPDLSHIQLIQILNSQDALKGEIL